MEIVCNKETLILLPERAVYWPRKKTLLLADMHLGKTGYFRSRGIQVPATVMAADLERLSRIIETCLPEQIIVAGDMFHHNYNSDIDLFNQWRSQHTGVDFYLVPGNHDRLLQIDYDILGIVVTPEQHAVDPFVISHQVPENAPDDFIISGHLHPGYTLEGRARQHLRLPCFIVSDCYIVLPAFSAFTGLYTGHKILDSCNYYLIAGEKIFRS